MINLSANQETKSKDDSAADAPILRPHVFHHLAHDTPVPLSLLPDRNLPRRCSIASGTSFEVIRGGRLGLGKWWGRLG